MLTRKCDTTNPIQVPRQLIQQNHAWVTPHFHSFVITEGKQVIFEMLDFHHLVFVPDVTGLLWILIKKFFPELGRCGLGQRWKIFGLDGVNVRKRVCKQENLFS